MFYSQRRTGWHVTGQPALRRAGPGPAYHNTQTSTLLRYDNSTAGKLVLSPKGEVDAVEENLSDTETTSPTHPQFSLLSSCSDCGFLLSFPPLVFCRCCCFLFVSRMWNETPAVFSGQRDLLKGDHELCQGFVSHAVMSVPMSQPIFRSVEARSRKKNQVLIKYSF